jgi:hypothetical protein
MRWERSAELSWMFGGCLSSQGGLSWHQVGQSSPRFRVSQRNPTPISWSRVSNYFFLVSSRSLGKWDFGGSQGQVGVGSGVCPVPDQACQAAGLNLGTALEAKDGLSTR